MFSSRGPCTRKMKMEVDGYLDMRRDRRCGRKDTKKKVMRRRACMSLEYTYIIYILYMKPVVNYVRKVHHLEDVCIS